MRKNGAQADVVLTGMQTDLDRDRRTTVAVRPDAALAARPRLFAALEAAFPICFQPAGDAPAAEAGALLDVCDAEAFPADRDPAWRGTPTLAIGGDAQQTHGAETLFGESESVDRRLRGALLPGSLDGPRIESAGGDREILAAAGTTPAWARAPGPVAIEMVAAALPELGPRQTLRELLFERPLALTTLIQLLRRLTAADAPTPPPLRAAILFDDPNLRWRTYGFIDYRRLLAHADEHDYHAAMAMIPLDGWRQHRSTVSLFRERADRLSLVLHGNNHLSQELMRPGGDAGAVALAAQAMRRAARFEARYGLRMDRVMTPPHGMCAQQVTQALGALGFDALCAIHPLPWTEHPPAERPLAGWGPAEFSGGCAVIPRIPLTTPAAEIALRAFLDQPLVLYGHHDDLAAGLAPLAEAVATVNRLGDVRWTSLGDIAATNHATRLEGSALRVHPYSHRLRVEVPEGARSLVVEPPREPSAGFAGWSASDSPDLIFGVAMPCKSGPLELRLAPLARIDAATVPSPSPSLWPLVRRAATETRDRLRPLLPTGSA